MVDFEFEFNNIQLYFLLLLVGFYIYSLIKLASIFWMVPEQRMAKVRRKSLPLRCLAHPLSGRRTGPLPARRVTALPVKRTKAWHGTISNESRHRIVRKLVTSTFSITSKSHRKPKYCGPMVAIVRILEASSFKNANSKPEYYQLISEKMHLLFRKELKQQRLMRRKRLQLLYLQRLPDPQMMVSPECYLHSEQRLPAALNDGHMVAVTMPSDERKEWHERLPCRSRMYMVNELMMAMLPTPDFPFPLESDTKHIVANAREVAKHIERDIFQTANSKGEYYQMMGDKMVAKNNKYHSETEEQMKKEMVVVVVPPEQPGEEDTTIKEVLHNTNSSYVMDIQGI